ncbi:MAG: 2-amino-4-hydroxy-6-hydroxymethyldihydropteridine diphosphokinase [Candidatus Omnitrophota bacterium]|nr:2-amino-4-hydroxy-6-hydroxymethyldihydropteridine diphosphokinase [Candidatus Omnitrophota bacterium]MBU1928546.1 2-amino-4-hydroxy-6-hydroxymethyldihydropteridine diphosphokinase [Candidatus Omnitrophota bacterium]MBU2034906.1 2-amino-4-hydroxy-6-hydroxymethyldihydropteridine diphosphokinase [Candidatus Omnitrophota bacterium]MBU2221364.1 2-amino-4-hydroxy-6-hydroxymethyldihydropteridine diphosphokinase [Candidatus Omnitrophota bacterium]MBU2258829.1 2-amino-4-hydroxy-6-hydroxymethyldihydro
MITSFIAIGSNLGERQFYIDMAIKKIKTLLSTRVVKISSIIETAPLGGPAQGKYLNAVIEIETELLPYQLLQELQKIEFLLGRVRTVANAPRTIDLDILTYSDICINEQGLCIPHPHIAERDFMLKPLKEIAPLTAAKFSKVKSNARPTPKSAAKPKVKLKTRSKIRLITSLKRKKRS